MPFDQLICTFLMQKYLILLRINLNCFVSALVAVVQDRLKQLEDTIYFLKLKKSLYSSVMFGLIEHCVFQRVFDTSM